MNCYTNELGDFKTLNVQAAIVAVNMLQVNKQPYTRSSSRCRLSCQINPRQVRPEARSIKLILSETDTFSSKMFAAAEK